MVFFLRTMISVVITLALVGCLNSQQPIDTKDVVVVGDACYSLKSEDSKLNCINSVARIARKKVEELPFTKPPTFGQAKEKITFKGINFDQPAVTNILMDMCKEDKENLAHTTYGMRSENRCVVIGNSFAMFNISYGPFTTRPFTLMTFTLDKDGSLLNVATSPQRIYVAQFADILSQKYGPPLVENDKVQNGLGEKFDRETYSWKDAAGTKIVLQSRNSTVNVGRFEISSRAYLSANENKIKKNIEAGKANL